MGWMLMVFFLTVNADEDMSAFRAFAMMHNPLSSIIFSSPMRVELVLVELNPITATFTSCV